MGSGITTCNCQNDTTFIEGSFIFENLKIRNLTFNEYLKIFEENKSNWIKLFNTQRKHKSFQLENFPILGNLMDSNYFSEHQRIFFNKKINKFISNLPDALIFFTALSFFTKLDKKKFTKKRKISMQENTNIDNLMQGVVKDEYDLIKDDLLSMCFKRNEHNSVTRLFIELVTEFTLDFIFSESDINEKESKENKQKNFKKKIFEEKNREKFLLWLEEMSNEKLYEYLFDVKNVIRINKDMERLYNYGEINDLESDNNLVENNFKNSNDIIKGRSTYNNDLKVGKYLKTEGDYINNKENNQPNRNINIRKSSLVVLQNRIMKSKN